MISDSHALSSHLPTPSIPAYTLNTCVRFRHPRLRPRYPHPRHRAYAFNTLAYALDAPTLDTTHTIQDSHVHLSMPPLSTPARTRSTPTCMRSTPTRTLAHMHRPDALHPWPSTHMQACEQVQGAWKRRRWCRHVCRGSVACGGFAAHGGVQKECQQGTGAARCADAPWRL